MSRTEDCSEINNAITKQEIHSPVGIRAAAPPCFLNEDDNRIAKSCQRPFFPGLQTAAGRAAAQRHHKNSGERIPEFNEARVTAVPNCGRAGVRFGLARRFSIAAVIVVFLVFLGNPPCHVTRHDHVGRKPAQNFDILCEEAPVECKAAGDNGVGVRGNTSVLCGENVSLWRGDLSLAKAGEMKDTNQPRGVGKIVIAGCRKNLGENSSRSSLRTKARSKNLDRFSEDEKIPDRLPKWTARCDQPQDHTRCSKDLRSSGNGLKKLRICSSRLGRHQTQVMVKVTPETKDRIFKCTRYGNRQFHKTKNFEYQEASSPNGNPNVSLRSSTSRSGFYNLVYTKGYAMGNIYNLVYTKWDVLGNMFGEISKASPGGSCRCNMAEAAGRIVSGGNIAKLPPPSRGRVPIDGKYKTETSKKYYNNPKGARITKASHFNFQYVLGHKIVFLCVARGNPLPQITWFKDGVELYAHKYMQLHEWTRGHKLKSKMEIDPASQADAGIYECHANNKYAIDSRAFRTTYLAEFN